MPAMQFKKSKQNIKKEEKDLKIADIDELSARLDEKLKIGHEPKKTILKSQGSQKEEKSEKKNYTISLSKKIIAELEEYLEDFGEFGESKSSFVENAIFQSIQQRKIEMKQKLLDKIKKLEL